MTSTRLVLLGTAGGPTPKPRRAAPAQAVIVDDRVLLIDCGNGVAQQMARAGVSPRELEAVFLTHHHSDHNADLGTVLLLAWAANLTGSVKMVGPPPLRQHLNRFFEAHEFDIITRMADEGRPDVRDMFCAQEITTTSLVHEQDSVRVTAALVHHPPISHAFAYRVDTPDRSIVVSGDTTPCDALVELAQGADVLVHEVIHIDSLGPVLKGTNGSRLREHLLDSHTPVGQVGAIAQAAGVSTLVLSHLVPGDDSVPEKVWLDEARRGFDGTVLLGQDLMEL